MASIFKKRGMWWARLKGYKVPGKWSSVPTPYPLDQEPAALEYAEEAQRSIDRRNGVVRASVFRDYIDEWTEKRREAGHDWKKDRGRLQNHVLPTLGPLKLADITTKHVADLVHELRFKAKLANRTVRNIYSVLAAALRDARIAGLIQQTPCVLTDQQLGAIVDKDPEWRAGALFTRSEAEAMISDHRIPMDRQLVYAFGLLAGLRPGEGAALRWRHYVANSEPLGRLHVALSYSTSRSIEKDTKTKTSKSIPVHPTLAAMLGEWWDRGWAAMMGRAPELDDLIVPLPPDVKRTKRTGDRFRGYDYTGRRWRELDAEHIGGKQRAVYDTKSTFITLAIDDGADPDILRDRVTHTKPKRSAFDGYDRGEHWISTCREVAKLSIRRLATSLLPPPDNCAIPDDSGSEGGFRRVGAESGESPPLQVLDGGQAVTPSEPDHERPSVVTSLRPRSDPTRKIGRPMPVKFDTVLARAFATIPAETGTVLNLETLVREVIAACGLEVAPNGEVYSPAPKPSYPEQRNVRMRGRRY